MAFFDNEVGTSRCGFDWFPSSMSSMDFLAMNHFLGAQSEPFPLVTPRRQKLNRQPPLPASHGVSILDAVALKNSAEYATYSKTASDTDSGTTTTTTTAAEHNVHSHVNKQKSLYKTELCRSWEERGRCPYGNKCQYAHGAEELRPVVRHPKFKTEVCCTFVTTGTCPYGRRCRFIHKNVPITAVGKQVCDLSKKNESYISSANSITASSRRLPIFVKLARGEE